MQISRIREKTLVIAIVVLLMTSSALLTMPTQALSSVHGGASDSEPNGSIPLPAGVTADTIVKSDIYLSFRPNPVGIGQPILVNVWLDPGPSYVRHFTGFKITLTRPDGTTDVVTVNSYPADGTAWFEYTPDQVGNWKAKFEFPGGYFPKGNYTVPLGSGTAYDGYTESYNQSVYYLPD